MSVGMPIYYGVAEEVNWFAIAFAGLILAFLASSGGSTGGDVVNYCNDGGCF